MEQDNQQLSSTTTMPVISRLDRLDHLLQQLEKKQSCSISNPIYGEEEVEKHCRPLSSALEEVGSKGTLMERLVILENRLLQLSLVMEDGNTSSSSASTDNIKHKNLPAEHKGKLIEGKGFQVVQKSKTCNRKKRTIRKKKSLKSDSRRFGWFHIGC